jgi:hypothetical protein
MATKNKILAHLDRDIIIKMLSDGDSPQKVSEFLTTKYPGKHNSHLKIHWRTIHDFRDRFMPSGKLSKIALQESEVPRWAKDNAEIKAELIKSSAYQEAIAKLAEEEINVKKELIQLMTIIKGRMEFYYNELQASGKMDDRNEKILLEQMKLLLSILQQQDKTDSAASGHSSEVSVNISIVRDHATVIRDAIRDTLDSVDPNLAIEFMERLNLKMKELEYTETTGLIPIGGRINV